MARMNPKRRRYAKQAALIASIVREHGPSHDDSAKLQQGSPRTSQQKYGQRVAMRGPKFGAHAPAWYKDGASMKYQGDK